MHRFGTLTVLAIAWTSLDVCIAPAANQVIDLAEHTPHFKWRTLPSGEQWIYDGSLPVGAFYAATDPMTSLARPISLHNLRLLPGGPLFIRKGESCGPLCLSWRKHLIFQMKIDALEVDTGDPERFRLYLKAHDIALRPDQPKQPAYEPENVSEETWLELSYDRDLPSYVFDVRTRMTVNPARRDAMQNRDFRGLEFGDLLPDGANDRFSPRGSKRYPWLIYRARDGCLYKWPQTHHLNQMQIEYAPDGLLAFVAEPEYNPVVEFVGGSGLDVRSEVCWAMYDVHFKHVRHRQSRLLAANKPLEVHYRVYSVPEAMAKQWLDHAKLAPVIEGPQFRLPAFVVDRVNRFEPSDEYRVPSDFWFWQRTDDNCRWVWDQGFQSRGSLTIERPTSDGQSSWHFDLIDSGHFAGYKLRGRYRIRARVRTRNVTGSVKLAWQIISPTREPEYSQTLSGTRDWTLVEIETADVLQCRRAAVRFIQEGAGTSWIDDLEIASLR